MNLVSIPRDGKVSLLDITLPEVATSVVAATVQLYAERGYVEPWVGYLAVEEGKCVGTSGFTSPPTGDVVEIAYFTFPDCEKRGIATQMAQRLISIAQNCDPSVKIIAHTLAEENASTRILRKIGFIITDAIEHSEDGNIWKWRYEKKCNPA